jgi:hypothetical protein
MFSKKESVPWIKRGAPSRSTDKADMAKFRITSGVHTFFVLPKMSLSRLLIDTP